jgi:hypothetical protein
MDQRASIPSCVGGPIGLKIGMRGKGCMHVEIIFDGSSYDPVNPDNENNRLILAARSLRNLLNQSLPTGSGFLKGCLASMIETLSPCVIQRKFSDHHFCQPSGHICAFELRPPGLDKKISSISRRRHRRRTDQFGLGDWSQRLCACADEHLGRKPPAGRPRKERNPIAGAAYITRQLLLKIYLIIPC